jgi:hypothetical protein
MACAARSIVFISGRLPGDALVRLDYGVMLNGVRQFDQALVQTEAAVHINADLPRHEICSATCMNVPIAYRRGLNSTKLRFGSTRR